MNLPAIFGAAIVLALEASCSDKGTEQNPIVSTGEPTASSVFADTSLEAAVRQALKKSVGILSEESLLSLTQLEARGRGIADLKGIELLQNLTALDLADNQIKDITPLAALSQLRFLDLDNNQVSNLSPLASLSQLESLILDRNRIADLTPLLNLAKLRSLELSGNPLSTKAVDEQLAALRSKGISVAFQMDAGMPGISQPVEGLEPATDPHIAFVSGSWGRQGDIFTLNVGRGTLVNLTQKPEEYTDLAWSPDGTKIAFISEDDPSTLGSHVFAIDVNGDNRVRLTGKPDTYEWLTWAPGRRILFTGHHLLNLSIFSLEAEEADGSQITRLTDAPNTDRGPTWSPDGTRIAFFRNRNQRSDVYIVDASGANPFALTQTPRWTGPPSWSPDGKALVFSQILSTRLEEKADIYLAEVGSGILVNLTDNPSADLHPVWSPDGTKIAFASDRDSNWEIYVMDADGSNPINLSRDSGHDIFPKWAPDGNMVAYIQTTGETPSDGYTVAYIRFEELSGIAFKLYLARIDGGVPVSLLPQEMTTSGTFAWAPR